jgi:hypothetical protein
MNCKRSKVQATVAATAAMAGGSSAFYHAINRVECALLSLSNNVEAVAAVRPLILQF